MFFSSIQLIHVNVTFLYCNKKYMNERKEKKVEEKIRGFKSSIIIQAKSSPDPFKCMQILWDKFAMPSLMYGIQPCPISRKGITNLDLIQSKMVNSAFEIPQNSQKVIALITTGF